MDTDMGNFRDYGYFHHHAYAYAECIYMNMFNWVHRNIGEGYIDLNVFCQNLKYIQDEHFYYNFNFNWKVLFLKNSIPGHMFGE